MNQTKILTQVLAFLILISGHAVSQDAPRNLGELKVTFEQGYTGWISVTAASDVFGDSAQWYPLVSGWDNYYVYTTFAGQHINRTGTPDNYADTIGYALYAISIGGYTIYYDFRDAEYATGAYRCLDVYLTYHPTSHHFERTDITPHRWINPGTTIGIWEDGNKYDDELPKLPVTISTSFSGGQLIVDQSSHSSPRWGD